MQQMSTPALPLCPPRSGAKLNLLHLQPLVLLRLRCRRRTALLPCVVCSCSRLRHSAGATQAAADPALLCANKLLHRLLRWALILQGQIHHVPLRLLPLLLPSLLRPLPLLLLPPVGTQHVSSCLRLHPRLATDGRPAPAATIVGLQPHAGQHGAQQLPPGRLRLCLRLLPGPLLALPARRGAGACRALFHALAGACNVL